MKNTNAFWLKAINQTLMFKTDHQKALFKKRLGQLEGKEFALIIDEAKPKRSEAQNRYYWLYVGIIADETGYTKDELHSLFKGKFLTREVKEVMGHKVRITGSSAELSKNDFSEFIMEIEAYTGITAPDTNDFYQGDGMLLKRVSKKK